MRPNSIIQFERVYILATVMSLIFHVLNIRSIMGQIGAILSIRLAVMLGVSMMFSLAVAAFFLVFIARKGNSVIRWIWVVLCLIGQPFRLLEMMTMGDLNTSVIVVYALCTLLEVWALILLFRPDVQNWFAQGGKAADLKVFG